MRSWDEVATSWQRCDGSRGRWRATKTNAYIVIELESVRRVGVCGVLCPGLLCMRDTKQITLLTCVDPLAQLHTYMSHNTVHEKKR